MMNAVYSIPSQFKEILDSQVEFELLAVEDRKVVLLTMHDYNLYNF